MKTIVQCDFDGTITEEDVSFLLLDTFADGNWRAVLDDYKAGRISVGAFNATAFAMVKADRQTLLDSIFTKERVKIRPGFGELLAYCSRKGIEFVIVSNGIDFYIEAILERLGITGVRVLAATSRFTPLGIAVQYIGPDGQPLEDSFKEAYTRRFVEEGYRVVYVGNGVSDIYPAKCAHHVFATADLLKRCQETGLHCLRFNDLNDVVNGIELLPLS